MEDTAESTYFIPTYTLTREQRETRKSVNDAMQFRKFARNTAKLRICARKTKTTCFQWLKNSAQKATQKRTSSTLTKSSWPYVPRSRRDLNMTLSFTQCGFNWQIANQSHLSKSVRKRSSFGICSRSGLRRLPFGVFLCRYWYRCRCR